jgi:hypothetical protein
VDLCIPPFRDEHCDWSRLTNYSGEDLYRAALKR